MTEREWVMPGTVRQEGSEIRLIAGRCGACASTMFPKAGVCPQCWSLQIDELELGLEGALYSYTVVHTARAGWHTPYIIAAVDMPEGVRLVGPLDLPAGLGVDALLPDGTVSITFGALRQAAEGKPSPWAHRFTWQASQR